MHGKLSTMADIWIEAAVPDERATQSFRECGHVTIDRLVSAEQAARLASRLDAVLRGEFDTGVAPDKFPGGSAQRAGNRTLQIINIWKADRAFAELVHSPALGEIVARFAGWDGTRVAQDQVWLKPPGAGPLVFHRDTTYFEDFSSSVVTVWLALDRMDDQVGPLEYVSGSHRWGDGRRGSAKHFFDEDRHALLHDAAAREGVDTGSLDIAMVRVEAGGAGIHDGRTWHGSGPNRTADRTRRGLGMHFVPASCVAFRPDVQVGRLWKKYVPADGSGRLPDEHFPVTWRRPGVAFAPAVGAPRADVGLEAV